MIPHKIPTLKGMSKIHFQPEALLLKHLRDLTL